MIVHELCMHEGQRVAHPLPTFSLPLIHQVPAFGYCDEVEMDALIALRSSLKNAAAAANVKLSYMPFLLKVVLSSS